MLWELTRGKLFSYDRVQAVVIDYTLPHTIDADHTLLRASLDSLTSRLAIIELFCGVIFNNLRSLALCSDDICVKWLVLDWCEELKIEEYVLERLQRVQEWTTECLAQNYYYNIYQYGTVILMFDQLSSVLWKTEVIQSLPNWTWHFINRLSPKHVYLITWHYIQNMPPPPFNSLNPLSDVLLCRDRICHRPL